MPNVGPFELILILAVVLLVFGPGKLPEIGKAVGNSFREFKEATSGSLLGAGKAACKEGGKARHSIAPKAKGVTSVRADYASLPSGKRRTSAARSTP